ncbi:MAG: tetratricopeptide repeat protein, partial [Chloroflexota bacterium]
VTTTTGALTLNHRFNRLRLQLRGSVSEEDTSDTDDGLGGQLINDDRDQTDVDVALRGSWEFKPTLFAFAEVQLNRRTFAAVSLEDGLSRDSRGERIRLGVSFGNTDQFVRGEIALGYGEQRPDNGALTLLRGVIVDANIALRVSALREAILHLGRALELLPEDKADTRIDLLIYLCEAEKYMGGYENATQHIERAIAIAKQTGDTSRLAHAEQELSDVLFLQGRLADALLQGEHSLQHYREQNDEHGIAKTLSHIGQIHNQQGDFAEAAELGEESIKISERLSDDITSIRTLTRLGITYFSMGRFDDASRNFERGLELSRKNNERRLIASSLLNLGNTYSVSGDLDRAGAMYEECLQIAQQIGDLRQQSLALNNLGYDNLLREDYETAQVFFEGGLEVMKRTDNRYEIANTYANMGLVAEKQGNMEQARAHYLESIAGANYINARPIVMESLAGIARIEPDDVTATIMVAIILNSDSTPGEVREEVQVQLESLQVTLGDGFAAAWAVGEARDVDGVVTELLAGYSSEG